MSRRVAVLADQLAPTNSRENDVVIVAAVRTPICKATRGGLSTTAPDVLLNQVLQAVVNAANVDPSIIQDICVGNVLQPGGGAVMARMAQFEAGLPETIPLSTTNRQCSSGLQAIASIFGAIKAGAIDCGIGAGVESMSFNSMTDATPVVDFDAVGDCQKARDCMIPMGITSENVAERYGISRSDQDAFAARSHAKAAAAQAAGQFTEIIPTRTKEGAVISSDDGIRSGTTAEGLSKLRPAFKDDGSTTAGNSSQVSDGAAAVLLMRRSLARKLRVPILGIMRSFAVVGVPPDIMGVGPAYAIPVAVQQAGLSVDDIDTFELNEAFASQAVFCIRQLGLDKPRPSASARAGVAPPSSSQFNDRVNPLGGAIALGHPLGCTGARQTATLLHYVRRLGKRYGVVSMCIGTGMGAAAVFEAEQ